MKEFQQEIKPSKTPLPIIIIGAGGIVNDAHMPAYMMANFSVLGVYDMNEEKAAALQRRFPSIKQVYSSMEVLVADAKKYRAVIDVAVPAKYIVEILKQLPDGSPVLIQKPMGETLAQAKEISDLCISKRLVAAINFQLKFAPYMLAAKDIISRGLLGKIYDMELMVTVFTPWHLWDFLFQLKRTEILYHSIHYIDLIRSFLGMPSKLYASTVKHPKMKELASTRSTIIMDYDSDTQARIITNHGHEFGRKHQQSYLKIEGTQGALYIKIGLSLNYPKGEPPEMEFISLKDSCPKWKKISLKGNWFPHAFIGSMTSLQNHYIDAKQALPHGVFESYETMKLVELAYKSSDEGGTRIKNEKLT